MGIGPAQIFQIDKKNRYNKIYIEFISLFFSGLTEVEQSKAGDQSTVTMQNHSDVRKHSPTCRPNENTVQQQ